jgi:hypothetical protein
MDSNTVSLDSFFSDLDDTAAANKKKNKTNELLIKNLYEKLVTTKSQSNDSNDPSSSIDQLVKKKSVHKSRVTSKYRDYIRSELKINLNPVFRSKNRLESLESSKREYSDLCRKNFTLPLNLENVESKLKSYCRTRSKSRDPGQGKYFF